MKIIYLLLVLHLSYIWASESSWPLTLKGMLRKPYAWPYARWNKDHYEGLAVDIIERIAAKLGFNYTLYFIPEPRWNRKMNFDKYNNQMIGELKAGNADFAIGDIVVSQSHMKDIDFTEPFMENIKLVGIMRKVEAVGLCNLIDIVKDNNTANVSYGTILHEHILGWLRSQKTLLYRFFQMMNVNGNNNVENHWDGLQKVNTLRYSYIVDSAFAEIEVGQNCAYTIITDPSHDTRSLAFALRKGSPWLQPFNAAIQELKTKKIMDELKAKYWVNKCGRSLYAECPSNLNATNII